MNYEDRKDIKVIAKNKKVVAFYFLGERFEAGLELKGTEVKSIRQHNVNFADSYVVIKKGEAFLVNMHISPYKMANIFNHDPRRRRRLLLHKRQIRKINQNIQEKHYTVVPTALYLNEQGRIKLEIAISKGKRKRDRRVELAKKDANRDIAKAIKEKL